MTLPRRRLKGATDLGQTIDERIAARSAQLDIRDGTGSAPAVPLSGGGAAGGGGGDDPAFPQSYVESLRKDDAGTARSGALVLEESGLLAITDKVAEGGTDRAFGFTSVSVLSVASLPSSPDGELIYRRTTDETLWWHDGGGWLQLGVDTDTCLWELDGSAITTVQSRALTLKKSGGEQTLLTCTQTGDSVARFSLSTDGTLGWGSGGGAQDLELRRGAAHRLELSDGDVLRLPEFLELKEITAGDCLSAPGGYGCLLVTAGRAYLRDDDGNLHDLNVQHEQTFWIAEDVNNHAHVTVPWAWQQAPGADGPPSAGTGTDPSAASKCTFTAPAQSGDPATLTAAHGRFSWTGVYQAEPPELYQAWVAFGVPVAKCGDCASAWVRLKVSNAARFASVKLSLMDSGGTSIASQSVTPTTSWAQYSVTASDMSGWSGPLRIVLTAEGAADSGAGATELDVEYLRIRQWTA